MGSDRWLWLQERALVLLQNLVCILPITGMEEPQRSRTQAELSCKSV